ncbi:MAG: PAS domain S-box protein [Chlorobiaceae bacterium]|nr:PAS domain S-box protein [Chlorobiaceae bacterium]
MKKREGIRHSEQESGSHLTPQGKALFFPVIGIGSSAGGLEALELFLKQVPFPCGMAIVIVQHLDPTHKGMMVELLQRVTLMVVTEVTDRLKIEPDHVYVIPPNQDMTILHGHLHLFDMVKPRGLRLPIDFFFRSMADDLQQNAIGVILSGMGSDGTLGLRAIKEQGGGVFVQDPASSKFDGMPRSAIDEGLADVIAPVETLPEKIIAYLKHQPIITASSEVNETRATSSLDKVVILLRTQTGHDFSLYKKNTVYRRIERRMGIHQIEKITDYVRFLQQNPHELELLFKELLIGVTSFFRDPAAWEVLKGKAIPSILAARPVGGMLRAWVAGCSTGEEAYSLAIVFREVIATLKPSGTFRLQIFATDLDKDAIDKARSGIYPLNISADVSPERLKRFFEKDDRGFRIGREIRESIVFAPHNVIMDPPFTKLDLLVCRNLLIYLEPELQKKLLPLFHYSLNPGGMLFLGSAETIGSNGHLFEPLDGKNRIFRQIHQGIGMTPVDFPTSFSKSLRGVTDLQPMPHSTTRSEFNMQLTTNQLLLMHFAASAVLTNDEGDIIYISGRTGKYLEPAAGKANMNVFAMARGGLRYELNLLYSSVLRQKGEMTKKGLVVSTEGGSQVVDLTVKYVDKPDSLKGSVLIVFADIAERPVVSAPHEALPEVDSNQRISFLENELRQAKDEIFSIREEMQTSQEELRSTNEEMQSANEELQSTNEELTTSKEEMQSLNEELQTVNQELQSKVSDLSQANNDMKNLLNSTDIATLFLDDELNVRRFTTRTATLIKLISGDIGRPITDIVSDLRYPSLADDAREVLHNLVFSEKQVSTNDGRWFTVKIMPYRTQENRIDGLVITFNEITLAKKFEQHLRQSEATCRFLIDATPLGALLQDADGKILMANREAERMTGITVEELCGKTVSELRWRFVRQDGSLLPAEEHPSIIALRSAEPVRGVVIGIEQPAATGPRWIRIDAIPYMTDASVKPVHVYTTFSEIDKPDRLAR